MKVKRIKVGPLATNCYLVSNKKSILIIDPGDDHELIYSEVKKMDKNPAAILATHGHFDHLLAVNELKLALDIPFYLHKKDEELLNWMRRSSIKYTKIDPGPAPKVDRNLKDGEAKIKDFKFKVIRTPGHTPGSVSLYFEREKTLFAGDLIFKGGGVGRYDFPYANKNDLLESIKRVLKLPGGTVVLSGHGEETTLEDFKNDLNLS